MSGWKALNIESDDESDIEIDDTKELQIEDALKLYQQALKLHAEGPDSYDLAAEAYDQLFQSDIFKYPESQIELRRIELYGPSSDYDDLRQDDFFPSTAVATGGLDSGPGTLPQILHLSHKNYAQFKLEHLTARLDMLNVSLHQILSDATAALDHFVEALDKDDTDMDLWRRTASVGELLDSKRVARYCLEAIQDGDDDALGNILSLPGLDEGLAGEQLRRLVMGLEDDLSVLQSPFLKSNRNCISRMLRRRLNTFGTMQDRTRVLKLTRTTEPLAPIRVTLKAPKNWAEVGELLLRQLTTEQHGTSVVEPAVAVAFDDPQPLHATARPQGLISTVAEAPVPNSEDSISSHLPKTIDEQFPGLDHGQPTAQPRIASADPSMTIFDHSIPQADVVMTGGPSVSLPTRKRSGDAAGLNESMEETRGKSKRTRLRESTNVDDNRQAIIDANIQWEFEQQINEIQAADDWMFETVGNLFERIGVVGFDSGRHVRQELQSPRPDDKHTSNGTSSTSAHESASLKLAKCDIQTFFKGYSDKLANVFLLGGDGLDTGSSSSLPGLSNSASSSMSRRNVAKPLLADSTGLADFVQEVNDQWLLTQEVAWTWITTLLQPRDIDAESTYRSSLWPEDLKTMVVRTLVNFDDSFFHEAMDELSLLGQQDHVEDYRFAEVSETIFELHLDIYCLIKEPNSGVDAATVVAQCDRLQRWSELARECMQLRARASKHVIPADELDLRFLWATTFQLGAASDVTQDHVIESMNDLRAIIVNLGEPVMHLQNNAIMPEISLSALDRELSRLTTREFFLTVTSEDRKDPVNTIENLEPLLNALQVSSDTELPNGHDNGDVSLQSSVAPDLIRFLQSSDISVRILLWQHLRDAYAAIDYKPMIVCSYFSMMRMLLGELKAKMSISSSQHERQTYVLKTMRLIQDMVAKTWTIVQKEDNAFECVDEQALKAAVSSFGEVLQLLQVFNVAGDSIRVGRSQAPTQSNGSQRSTYINVSTRLQEMQVHTWLILYALLKEAILQFHDLFPAPAEDMFDFLRVVHRNLGLRGLCGSMNKVFVRTLKDEFVNMTHVEGYDSEQAQVLYDLYGLNCFLNPSYELIEHHCQHDAFIERSVATQAVDLLLQQASKLPIKDLVKHPIKETIDKVHGAAPRKKPTEAILRNREIYRSFLKSPINPLDLYLCLKGEGNHLAISYVSKEDALLGSKGWYFLMGHIALTKFRTQKRTAPTPTEDVDIAIAFFMQDLEYSMDKWETWFRLAQAYDTKIEESVVWSAEKLNNSMPDLVQLQRAAIHCYTMAMALAYRSADFSEETSEKMTELHIDFANRIYASSRQPLSMLPFSLEGEEKFLSLVNGGGVSKGKPFEPLRPYTAWKLSKVLFQRALKTRSQSWILHFQLGKCLWKMHTAFADTRPPRDVPPSAQEVLATFIRALELLPDEKKKDSREKREPILEPHYKLVSIVHKLVSRGELGLDKAKEALDHTPYARSTTFPADFEDWVPFILGVLKTLRAADKSNWHHRMVARAAQIIWDDSDPHVDNGGPGQNVGAMGAKHEFTQQMFTKTMVQQVWRPEAERAGRHFVYTARYTRFFVQILELLRDRTSLEMLARRVRRRPHEYFEHGLVWQEICHAYLRLLRSYGQLEEGAETSTFSNIAHEDFLSRKEPLEKWMQATETGISPALDVLREVQELKKINASLMKPGPIDDLIGDAYAALFKHPGKQLWDDEQRIKREEEANRPPPALSPPRNPMMSLNHLMNLDGTGDMPTMATTTATVPPGMAVPPIADQAPARRKIGVGRREIRMCAEACIQKPNAAAASKIPASYARVQVVIESSGIRAGDVSVDTSAPGSVHDSADDESELSELEEEGEDDEDGGAGVKEEDRPRLMFPGLANNVDSCEASADFTGDVEVAYDDADVEMDEGVATKPENGDGEVNGLGELAAKVDQVNEQSVH